MCVVDTPEIPKSDPTTQDKPLPIIRNPYLDGLLGNIAALRGGRNALRIDLANPLAIPTGPGGGDTGGGSVVDPGDTGGTTGRRGRRNRVSKTDGSSLV